MATRVTITETLRVTTGNGTNFDLFTEDELAAVDVGVIDLLVDNLRRTEASARRLRKRLEALQGGGDARACGSCGGPMVGRRADARYCSADCRVRAHRDQRKAEAVELQ
ncbi:hypothetical protein [Pseudonocardia sp. WMMC193]|uniref:hypothetical protein n=1 Tax=Pseudonocardia sp. WMMC193 TaxID=2911965 RepID=UPI001F41962B|nr:hypothetical protein [Pseudonocardia sp. WMMC193]MCF7550496.1 hypothetical protein [Pseudonocardia sp. WMMC193]